MINILTQDDFERIQRQIETLENKIKAQDSKIMSLSFELSSLKNSRQVWQPMQPQPVWLNNGPNGYTFKNSDLKE